MTEKPKTPKKTVTRKSTTVKSENLAQLSATLMHDAMNIIVHMIDAGASNLMEGYAATIIVSDLMHSAGLLSDPANEAISGLSTIIEAVGVATNVIGIFTGASNAFQPQLKTRVEQSINEKGEGTQKSTQEASGRAAQQLGGLIPELATAAAAL